MRHVSTRAVFAHWSERRGNRPAPERREIDPSAIRHALGDTFILAADLVAELRFRLAGTRLCALFCRELKGESFGSLWSEPSESPVRHLVSVVCRENVGAVASVVGRAADGERIELEMLLLPLAPSDAVSVRALGVLAPLAPPFWLGMRPLAELELAGLRRIGSTVEALDGPGSFAAPSGARRWRGLRVHDGGRTLPQNWGRG